jgi:hypothetical protein
MLNLLLQYDKASEVLVLLDKKESARALKKRFVDGKQYQNKDKVEALYKKLKGSKYK